MSAGSTAFSAAERIAETLLYEGYVLYPYRRSSLKNRQRMPLHALYPEAFCANGEGDPSCMQSECLIAGASPSVRISVRLLQLSPRTQAPDDGAEPWHEAIERRIDSELLALAAVAREPLRLARELPAELRVELRVGAEQVATELWRLRVAIENRTAVPAGQSRRAVLPQTLASPHTLLACDGGRFVSLLEPPPEWHAHAAACANVGSWPVLIGEPGARDVMLSSPIILYDYPRIAPESPGDFFDATEIDELLTLRVLTLTEQEKREALRSDPRAARVLARTAALGEARLEGLHGTERSAAARSHALAPGARVRIKPRPGGDVLDLALADELATVASVEQDFEGRVHYTVTVDCDPGRDLGLSGQPGHRFFFFRDELEQVP